MAKSTREDEFDAVHTRERLEDICLMLCNWVQHKVHAKEIKQPYATTMIYG